MCVVLFIFFIWIDICSYIIYGYCQPFLSFMWYYFYWYTFEFRSFIPFFLIRNRRLSWVQDGGGGGGLGGAARRLPRPKTTHINGRRSNKTFLKFIQRRQTPKETLERYIFSSVPEPRRQFTLGFLSPDVMEA